MTLQRILKQFLIWLSAAGILCGLIIEGHARPSVYIPDQLAPWKAWVLHGKEKQLACIPMYDKAGELICAWPGRLTLNLNDKGGTFEQSWQIYTRTRIAIPGSSSHWPMDVSMDSSPAVVLADDDHPGLMVPEGTHMVTGRFSWQSLPEHLNIPASTGLVTLVMNNTTVTFPELDQQGRLWLRHKTVEKRSEDRLKVECSRLIEDDIPARMSIELTLEVSGQARQMTMGPVYREDRFIPVSFKSPLPARLESDGRITIQVRPGRFQLSLNLRHAGPLKTAQFIRPDQEFWPQKEIWSFSARTDLRRVEISGAVPVDPKQTTIPSHWQSFPSYLMAPATTLTFKQVKRGDPSPAPDQLSLDRTLWLRFDGSGYFIQDRIAGKKNTNWRLELTPDILPGQVIVDGREQLITIRQDSTRPGIELRNGKVDILADSTFGKGISRIPATGWDHDFKSVKGRLNLPPGWTLIRAGGVDRIPGTWVSRWTLLDFFVVLIFTIALSRVYSKPLALVAFITLTLTFHEFNAPKYIWLALLIGFTLLKYLPPGRMRTLIRLCQAIVLVFFVVIVIPWAIHTLRIGIYPELARPWMNISRTVISGKDQPRAVTSRAMKDEARLERSASPMIGSATNALMKKSSKAISLAAPPVPERYESTPQVMQYDPKARTQTGPGMPLWPAFKTIDFSWSGPVNRGQSMSLFLIGPRVNLILALVRVALVVFLAAGMLGLGNIKNSSVPGIRQMLPVLAVILLCLMPAMSRAADFPSPAMLEELESRLIKADKCFSHCADLPLAAIDLNADRLLLHVQVHAAIDTAIPLPGDDSQWLPTSIRVDGQADAGLFKKEDKLWVMVPGGIHEIEFQGPIRRQNGFQLVFPLKPRHLDMIVEGWSVEGRHSDGSFDAQLQFKPMGRTQETKQQELETGVLPVFAKVERTLLLGLVWKIETRVTRQGDANSGMVLNIPLLPGESITTEGIRVENNTAKINFHADQKSLAWDSFLAPAGQIRLTHADTRDWTEIWKVDVSPIFHMKYNGTPVIFHKTGDRWYPTWHPWPGETLTLSVTRPRGIDGQTLTIEKSLLELAPGRAATTAKLTLFIKSSQGGRHTITLPDTARLQEVSIQGRIRPIRQENSKVTLPIVPGEQKITLQWMDSTGIRPFYQTPVVDLGIDSANTCLDVKLGANRWPLFLGGEQAVGPAVLFWSELIVILIIAFALSKTGWTPLNFFQWCLLFLGMSMSHPGTAIITATWLVALEARPKADHLTGMKFNLVQTGILALTLGAGACLIFGISNGLLGHPDMSIQGNGSRAGLLRWYHDVSGQVLPKAWIVSIPIWTYRVAMLAWALWVSFWLINILKWGWQRCSTPDLWARVQLRRPVRKQQTFSWQQKPEKKTQEPAPPESDNDSDPDTK